MLRKKVIIINIIKKAFERKIVKENAEALSYLMYKKGICNNQYSKQLTHFEVLSLDGERELIDNVLVCAYTFKDTGKPLIINYFPLYEGTTSGIDLKIVQAKELTVEDNMSEERLKQKTEFATPINFPIYNVPVLFKKDKTYEMKLDYVRHLFKDIEP